jgi:hypothetical protein
LSDGELLYEMDDRELAAPKRADLTLLTSESSGAPQHVSRQDHESSLILRIVNRKASIVTSAPT